MKELQPSCRAAKTTAFRLTLNPIISHTHIRTQHTDFPTESAPWEVQARAAALIALQRHWFPHFPVSGLSGVSLLSSPEADLMPMPTGAHTPFAGYD